MRITVLLLLPSYLVATAVETLSDKPNIVFILADDMGMECLSSYGSNYNTPNLDRLSAKGMKFEHCYSQPLSSPSRAELMTGKYNHRNHYEWGNLDNDNRTFANLAKEAGYTTCVSGKWQLGEDTKQPQIFGFDEYCLWKFQSQGSRYCKPVVELKSGVMNTTEDDYGPDIFSKYVLDFIDANKNKLFFVYYPMVLIHSPHVPTPHSPEWKEQSLRNKVNDKFHWDMVEYVDFIVGKIVDKVEKLGLDKNTIIIFTADNGSAMRIEIPMKNGTGVKGGKSTTRDAGIHVPFIVRWDKKIKAGSISKDLIDFSDFYPTLASIFKINITQEKEIDGVNFQSILLGKPGRQKPFCYSFYDPILEVFSYVHPTRYSFNDKYKLYVDGRFYNTETDVPEHNPITVPTAEEDKLKEHLQKVLDQYVPAPAIEEMMKNPVQQTKADKEKKQKKAKKLNLK